MFRCFKKDCLWGLGVGAVLGAVAISAAKTPKARNLAVHGLAKGMMAKDSVMETVANLQDEAEDICAEARAVAKENADCECHCGCSTHEAE